MSCVCGKVELCFSLSRCVIRLCISGVKFGLQDFMLPLGMLFLSALFMIMLNCLVVASMFVIGVLFSVVNCCSVSSVYSVHFAFL